MTNTKNEHENVEFSLVSGGPLFRLYRWVKLSGLDLELAEWRALVAIVIAWLPLVILSLIDGRAFGDSVSIPFLYDVSSHARFLVALPVLIGAEALVHDRVRSGVQNFLKRNIVTGDEIPKFKAAVDSAHRIRNSFALEIVLLVLVYTVGTWLWRSQIAIGVASWYASPDQSGMNLTPAGFWFSFVSGPLFQFILLRWYARFFIWFWFLLKVSKLKLNLIATSFDRAGGLGFLGKITYSFSPVLFAQGALFSGLVASEVFHDGKNVLDYKVEAFIFVLFFVVAVISPLCVLSPILLKAKRRGRGLYGSLAARYVGEFDDKWIQGNNPRNEDLLGNADIQSLADLESANSVVGQMHLIPISMADVLRLAIVALVPILPLALFVLSPGEIVDRILKVLF